MELEKYIQSVGDSIPSSLHMITEYKFKGSKYDFVMGSDEYPNTFMELISKIKRQLWQRN